MLVIMSYEKHYLAASEKEFLKEHFYLDISHSENRNAIAQYGNREVIK